MIALQIHFEERLVLLSTGIFFLLGGFYATLLNMAWNIPGPAGAFLKNPLLSIIMLALMALAMLGSAVLGVLGL
jgi:hypothetical protein